jgi:ankyrin repeat protein
MGNIIGNIYKTNNIEQLETIKCVQSQIINDFGQNSLMLAINNKDEIQVKEILDNENYLNSKDNYGWSPVLYAIHTGSISILKLILEKKPDLTILTNNNLSILDHAKLTRNQDIINLIKKSNDVHYEIN